MEIKFIIFISLAFLLIGYYLYVLYKTLQYKRKYGKTADAQDLYLRTGPFHLMFFGKLFKNDEKPDYKVLREEEDTSKN